MVKENNNPVTTRKCTDSDKCETFLDVGDYYETKDSVYRDNCYSVLISDKKQRIKSKFWADFKKCRFE